MERVYKSKVGWWYHLLIIIVIIGCVAAFLRAHVPAMIAMLLIARMGFFPEKRIAIADIEALESSVIPVPSYALSLGRIVIWSDGKPWLLISPVNQSDFIKQLRKINPNIQLK